MTGASPHVPLSHSARKGSRCHDPSITPITVASGGGNDTRTDEKALPEHGLVALLGKEGRGLISLARDALHETSGLVHEMHAQLHTKNTADVRNSSSNWPRPWPAWNRP